MLKNKSWVSRDFSVRSPVSDNVDCVTSPQAWSMAFGIFASVDNHTGNTNPYVTSLLILVANSSGRDFAEL